MLAVMLISPFLAEAALKFGAPEMFALLFFAFTCIGTLVGKSVARGLLMAVLGLLLGVVGTDDIHGVDRLHLRDSLPARRHRPGSAGHGPLRPRGDFLQHRAAGEDGFDLEGPQESSSHPGGLEEIFLADPPRQRARIWNRGFARRNAGRCLAHELCGRENGSPNIPNGSAGERSKGWPVRRRPTMPLRPAASSPC